MTTTERGYGKRHQKLRAEWAIKVRAGTERCVRCGRAILIGARCPKCGKPTRDGKAQHGWCGWDLGHFDGSGKQLYTGPEHSCCNRATATHRLRRVAATARGRISRGW